MANKQPKPELVAIYRLEFYKKQKNWKFSCDSKSKSKSLKSKKTHNATYNIKAESSDSPLNRGLIEETQEKNDYNCKHMKIMTETFVCNYVPEKMLRERASSAENWQNSDHQVNEEEIWKDAVDGDSCGVDINEWFGDNQAWCHQPRAEESAISPWGGEIRPHSPARLHRELDAELWKYETEGRRSGSSSSTDSLAEFTRGAHVAPHSSELDLTDEGCTCSLATDRSSLARLTSRQLAAGVDRHAKTLSMLLKETALRDRASQVAAHPDIPTRDCPGGAGGRGRGRLHETRVIGIGMGRPYRLQ